MDDFDLTGRVAIITGGNSGIGLGMADALARAGCAISIWGHNAARQSMRGSRDGAIAGATRTFQLRYSIGDVT